MRMANVVVLADRRMMQKQWNYGINAFEVYIHEILAHAGISFARIDSPDELPLQAGRSEPPPDVLIAALENDDRETADRIWSFAERGGAVISYGRLDQLAERLGCVRHKTLPEAYASAPATLGDPRPLRALNVRPWVAGKEPPFALRQAGSVAPGDPGGGGPGYSLLQTFAVGSGTIARFSVDIPRNVVQFQQGPGPVVADGLPAPDGSASVDDGILKADDGIAMDWEDDRMRTESGQPFFPHPYADLWREVCLAQLLQTVAARKLTLPFIGYWPDGMECVATVSHDSDGNDEEGAERTLSLLKEAGIHSTWCMIEPGYRKELYDKILREGHELAFHYNGLEAQGGIWSGEEFARQLHWLEEAAPAADISTNKNHFTRFEGWGELFRWCEECGISADQSRGPSKSGNVGFLFGTCHAYFPVAWADERNRMYDVLEIGFLTQDLDIEPYTADRSIAGPMLDQVRRVEGIAHFLFHQRHLYAKPRVADAFCEMIAKAKQRGFAFWTANRIDRWERGRRQISFDGSAGDGTLWAGSSAAMEDVVVWLPVPEGQEAEGRVEMKFGIPCLRQVHTFHPSERKQLAAAARVGR